jgi:hypothetical protein
MALVIEPHQHSRRWLLTRWVAQSPQNTLNLSAKNTSEIPLDCPDKNLKFKVLRFSLVAMMNTLKFARVTSPNNGLKYQIFLDLDHPTSTTPGTA